MNIIGFIPARGGSKGIPRKNIKLMGGKPLIVHSIETAMKCPLLNRIVVNTEDPEIETIAKNTGVDVQGRPEKFWYDNSFQEVDRLLVWAVNDLEKNGDKVDIVVLLYPTAPLRSHFAILDCINLVLKDGYDSALTLKEDRSYIWRKTGLDNEVEPTNYDPMKRGPNQLEGWNQWVENKAVYVVKRDLLINSGCRLGGKIGFVEMSKSDSIDIDTPDDFILAEQIMKLKNV